MIQFTPKLVTTLRNGYTKEHLRADAIAGLTVAIVALPLAMALAIASGASPDKGLITAVIAGFFISVIGGSRVQVGGPTGAFVVIIFNVIAQYGYDGLVLATAIAGILLVLAGYFRLGHGIKFVSPPVITGFTAGIAVIIATSQVKDFFGLQLESISADFLAKWSIYLANFSNIDFTTFAVGASSLMLVVFLRRVVPKIPSYLMVIIMVAGIVAIFKLPVATIGSRFPEITIGLPVPTLPEFNLIKIRQVFPSACIIAFLAGLEALLSAVVADGITGFKHRSNQELVGQGVANIASALFGGLPATGAIARTAANIKAGGRTPVAGVFHAVFVLVFVLFAMDLIKFVPMATLAAILLVVAWGMSEINNVAIIIKASITDAIVLLTTFFLTVLLDLTIAISVGAALAFVFSRVIDLKNRKKSLAATEMPQEESVETNQKTCIKRLR